MEFFRVSYYANDLNDEESITVFWGCTIEDPPDMYRR